MSKEHHYFTPSEMLKSIEVMKKSTEQEMHILENKRISSMFDVKFKNPHDIIGEKGLVKVHQKEVEKEKVNPIPFIINIF